MSFGKHETLKTETDICKGVFYKLPKYVIFYVS